MAFGFRLFIMLILKIARKEDRTLLWNIHRKYLYEMTRFYNDSMDEFSIFPAFRRKHLATEAVKAIFEKHPGKREIKFNEKNTAAKRFWEKITAEYAPVKIKINSEETVLSFCRTFCSEQI